MVWYFIFCLMPALLITWFHAKLYKGIEQAGQSVGKIDKKEFIISIAMNGAIALVSVLIFHVYFYTTVHDTEILNGYVSNKEQVRVSCSHSYQCKCEMKCSTSNGKQDCKMKCKTCHRHANDYDWQVETTVGSFSINRIDSQGIAEPPRYTNVVVGEPASRESYYQNYILADKTNLFLAKGVEVNYDLPEYPRTTDYYRYNRVINLANYPDIEWLNSHLNEWLKYNGKKKEVNIIVLITNKPRQFFDALLAAWSGGKKNDIIMVFGVDGKSIKWFEASSYANGMHNRELLTDLRDVTFGKDINPELIDLQLKLISDKFNRLSAKEFEDKLHAVEIPNWLLFVVIIVNIISSAAISRYMLRK